MYYATQSIQKTLSDNTAELNIAYWKLHAVSSPSKSVRVVLGPLLGKDPLCFYSCKRPPPVLTTTECSHSGGSLTGGSIVLSTHLDYWQVNVFPKVRKQHLIVGDFRTYGFSSTGLWITNRLAGHSYIHFYLFHSFKNKGTLIFSHQQTSREVKSHRQAIRKTNWYRGLYSETYAIWILAFIYCKNGRSHLMKKRGFKAFCSIRVYHGCQKFPDF